MDTKLLNTDSEAFAKAGEIIRRGGLVAFPTETVYGLGADALNGEAVAKVYQAKGRPSDNPMIVHIAEKSGMDPLAAEITEDMEILMDKLWPGPLTMIVKKKAAVPDRTTGGLDTVAVRMPESEAARKLIVAAGCPIAAPSANLSGSPSPTRAKDVIDDMYGRIDAIIQGEDCQVGIESTVVDMTGEVPTILRPGIITAEDLSAALGKKVKYDRSLKEGASHMIFDPAKGVAESDFKPKSPGMKYKHYAPKAEMIIIQGDGEKVRAKIQKLQADYEGAGKKVGVLLFGENEFAKAAHDFFSELRDMDKAGDDIILAGALKETDEVGFAVMNRMLKSAGYNIIKV